MPPPHYVTLVTRTDFPDPRPHTACTNSYIAVAFLQSMAQEKGLPLTTVETNRFYRIGQAEYSFTEVRLLDMAWLKTLEAGP